MSKTSDRRRDGKAVQMAENFVHAVFDYCGIAGIWLQKDVSWRDTDQGEIEFVFSISTARTFESSSSQRATVTFEKRLEFNNACYLILLQDTGAELKKFRVFYSPRGYHVLPLLELQCSEPADDLCRVQVLSPHRTIGGSKLEEGRVIKGRSKAEAVGNWMMLYGDRYGIEIV